MNKPPLHLPTVTKAKPTAKPKSVIPQAEKALYIAWKEKYKASKYANMEGIMLDCPKWKSYSNFLEDAIRMWAKAHGAMSTKIDVRGTFRNGRYTTTKATKGVEDVQLVIRGRLVAIEVKAGADKMSDAQIKRANEYKAQGVPYHVVKTLNDFTIIIEQYL